MSLVVVGASHRTAPLDLLERMSVGADRVAKLLDNLSGREHVSEAVLLSTCNRTEVYVVAERFHGAYRDVRDFFCDLTFLPPDELSDHLMVGHDDDAVRHLFRVAAGLESVVVGEHEILGQVRSAWDVARRAGTTGPSLNLVFRHAVETGKRARTETAIARHVTSVSQAAVVMAAEQLGGLPGRRALVLGAGEVGRGMVQLLVDQDLGELAIVNRTFARAHSVAETHAGGVGTRVARFEDLREEMIHADVVFTSTAAASPLVAREDVEWVMQRRPGRPLVVVDVAVPRDVDPDVAGVDGVTLLDMDALARFAERGLSERRREVPAVEAIVEREARRYTTDASAREVAPLIGELHQRAEQARLAELERYAAKLAQLDPATCELVEAMTRGVVAKLLHEPTVKLKGAAGTLRGERLATSLRDLFDL